ncbi:SapC family protein [Halomonas sp. IOP_31]|uniref:SapC family protein n=1 Tax=Halomonas sp. IOP_31 TaxID=2876584 RepID=UPI001E5867E0|nr:SapC family protein [Halomonas sp. IOP_31]MCD6008528.1 SapC family protein [Halomonas sp. IOP_31]
MPQWIAISRTQHAEHHYQPRQGYRFAAEQPVASILLAELPKLLPHYALGFIQQGEQYQPVALLGLDGQTNLYVAPNGKWLGSYVPASLRGYPFTLANTEDGQTALCIAQDHLLESEQGEPLFDGEGRLNERVQQTLNFLQECEKSRQLTQQAAKALGDSGVIEPWPLQVERGEGQEPLKVQGLYRINETALNELSAEAFASLRSHGALALAYGQLFSMHQLSQLTERAKFHAKHQAQQPVEKAPSEPLESLFGGDDDEMVFDFGE